MRNNLYINFLYNNCYSTFLSKNNIEKIDLYINNYNEKIVNNITNIKKEYYQKFIDVYHTKELSKLTQDSPLGKNFLASIEPLNEIVITSITSNHFNYPLTDKAKRQELFSLIDKINYEGNQNNFYKFLVGNKYHEESDIKKETEYFFEIFDYIHDIFDILIHLCDIHRSILYSERLTLGLLAYYFSIYKTDNSEIKNIMDLLSGGAMAYDGFSSVHGVSAYFSIKYYGSYCPYCGGKLTTFEMEHILPQSKFPNLQFHWDNLVPCCGYCNQKKSNGTNGIENITTDKYNKNLNDIERISRFKNTCRFLPFRNDSFIVLIDGKPLNDVKFLESLIIGDLDISKRSILLTDQQNNTYNMTTCVSDNPTDLAGLNTFTSLLDQRNGGRVEAIAMAMKIIQEMKNYKIDTNNPSFKPYLNSIIFLMKEKGFVHLWMYVFKEYEGLKAYIIEYAEKSGYFPDMNWSQYYL